MMKENFELLTELKRVNPDVNLRINTNLSKVDTRIFELICEFKNVHWIVSTETIENEYEFIRHGGSWVNFVENLDTIQKLGYKITFNMLHFILNYDSIFDCIDFLKQKGYHDNSFVIGPLLRPEFLNIRHLPDDILNALKGKLSSMVQGNGYLLDNGLQNMIKYIDSPFEKNLDVAIEKVNQLGYNRGLDPQAIFKKLYEEIHYGN